MKLKTILPLICLLFLSLTKINAQQPGTADGRHKVVIQLTSGDTLAWKGVLKNITHLYETWGDKVQIEIVAHGHGVEFLVNGKTTQEARIGELALKGVLFRACENSLKDRKLTRQDVITAAGTVPSGVVEVVMKEEEGWSYLKAGF
jgi:intracellular sulfur oxidation DsrE/DsrF family protein